MYTVESISSKIANTKFGPKPAYSVKANGEWFKHGFKKPTFKEGDVCEWEYKEGAYGKDIDVGTVAVITTGSKSSSSSPAPAAYGKPAPYTPPRSSFPIGALDGQRSIVRQNCVTNAREIFTAMLAHDKAMAKMTKDEWAENVIALARKFEAYACGELDLAVATKKSLPSVEEVASGE